MINSDDRFLFTENQVQFPHGQTHFLSFLFGLLKKEILFASIRIESDMTRAPMTWSRNSFWFMSESVFKRLNGSTSCRFAIHPNHDRSPVKPPMWALHLDLRSLWDLQGDVDAEGIRWISTNEGDWIIFQSRQLCCCDASPCRYLPLVLYLLPSHQWLAISPNHGMDIVDDILQRLGPLLPVSLQKHLFVKRLNLLSSKRFPSSASKSWKTELVSCLFELIVSTSFKGECDKSLRLSWSRPSSIHDLVADFVASQQSSISTEHWHTRCTEMCAAFPGSTTLTA